MWLVELCSHCDREQENQQKRCWPKLMRNPRWVNPFGPWLWPGFFSLVARTPWSWGISQVKMPVDIQPPSLSNPVELGSVQQFSEWTTKCIDCYRLGWVRGASVCDNVAGCVKKSGETVLPAVRWKNTTEHRKKRE